MSLDKYFSRTSCTGPSDLGSIDGSPVQPQCRTYAPQSYGTKQVKQRDFQSSWFRGRDWLEFSMEKKGAFCYCCRHFSKSNADKQFSVNGYSNWQHALEKNKGLIKHASSAAHVQAMLAWKERRIRKDSGQSVSTLVNETQLEKNRYYIRSIAEVIQFLCVNELALRGDKNSGFDTLDDKTMDEPSGLFLRLFEYTMKKDEKLKAIYPTIPKNACYTSAMMQNEIIEIMKSVVLNNAVADIKAADIPWFTLKSDGTRDPTNTENISIVVRFVKGGNVHETLVAMATSEELDASALTETILRELEECGLDTNQVLSQCYDGASVMSGKNGGVQKKIQEKLGREIPYVHCFNHQLHLVVVHAIGENMDAEKFFGTCSALYKFVRRPKLDRLYDGSKLKRLLEQRWSGHLETTTAILKNHNSLVDLLEACEDAGCDAAVCVEAAGLLKQLRNRKFMFVAYCVLRILEILKPVDKMLQSRDCDIMAGIGLINSTVHILKDLRQNISQTCYSILQQMNAHDLDVSLPSKRRRKLSQHLKDSVVLSSVGQSDVGTQNSDEDTEFRRLFADILDSCIGEIDARFGERNCKLLKSLSKLWPQNQNFLEVPCIQDFIELIGLDPNCSLLGAECTVAKAHIMKAFNPDIHKNLGDICAVLYPMRSAFSFVYQVYAAAVTFGASTAVCEASFSTLTRILTPYRRSMTHQRKSNLVMLAFLHEYTKSVDFNHVLKAFVDKKRRIQLY